MVGSLFLCQNLTMKEIFNPYLSNDDKDILFEMQLLEEIDATLSTNGKLSISTNATAICRQIGTIAKSISAGG